MISFSVGTTIAVDTNHLGYRYHIAQMASKHATTPRMVHMILPLTVGQIPLAPLGGHGAT